MQIKSLIPKFIMIFSLTVIFYSCKSSDVEKILSAEERFELGIKEYEKGNYLEAINEFSIITMQYPGSAVSDDAQFFLGECRFKREEYLLASYEFETLKRNMPASPLVPKAQYKIAMCYYMLSPKSYLDQTYSFKAIDEFQTFIEYFPDDSLVVDAENKISELREKLAKKDFDTAILYTNMEYYKAATFYYDKVIDLYHDTKYSELAYVGKIEVLIKRKKYDEAKLEAEIFLKKYPQSKHKYKVELLVGSNYEKRM